MKPKYSYQSGFTLVEVGVILLAITIILLAVTKGGELIKKSRLNSVITTTQDFRVAVDTFKEKYHYFPGDIPEADRYWPASVCTTSGSFPCSNGGDGDTRVEWLDTGGEDLRAWQHLSLAGMINSAYSGVRADNTPASIIIGKGDGTDNIPAAAVYSDTAGQGGYHFAYNADNTLPSNTNPQVGNIILVGAVHATTATNDLQAILSPIDAAIIDSKIDDGEAETGNVYSLNGSGKTGCIASNDYTSNTTLECIMWFRFE